MLGTSGNAFAHRRREKGGEWVCMQAAGWSGGRGWGAYTPCTLVRWGGGGVCR